MFSDSNGSFPLSARVSGGKPGTLERRVDLLFVELNYGRELAERVRVFQRERETKGYSKALREAEI